MATENDILMLHSVLPNRQETSVLFVGAEGTSKHVLSLAMLNLPVQFSLQIRTASSLPLSEENAATRPRIDFSCFLINMTDRDSIQIVQKSLSKVDVKFFLDRACLIVTGAHNSKRMTDTEQVTALGDSYHLPLVFGEILYYDLAHAIGTIDNVWSCITGESSLRQKTGGILYPLLHQDLQR